MRKTLVLAALMLAATPLAMAHNHEGGAIDHAAETATAGTVTISDSWSRAAIAGGNGAAYATIASNGAADRLIAVKGDVATAIEIHEMSTEGGVMQMRKLDGLDVPAGGRVELKPGGNHIMLIGLTRALNEGDTLTLTFVFEKAGEVNVALPIGKAGGTSHDRH